MATTLFPATTAFGDDYRFGSALYPPSQWPNPNDHGVRGKIYDIPYYPGYFRPHDHGLFRFGRYGTYGFGNWEMWPTTGTGSDDYGIYSGGPRYETVPAPWRKGRGGLPVSWTRASMLDSAREEDFLLHLGGNGPSRPSTRGPDIIDCDPGRLLSR